MSKKAKKTQSVGEALGSDYEDFKAKVYQKPKTDPPEPVRCSGTDIDGVRCHVRINPFHIFGKWQVGEYCERCSADEQKQKQREQLIGEAFASANIRKDLERQIITPDEAQFLDHNGGLLYYWHSRGVTSTVQQMIRQYIVDRTSTVSKASALYSTEYLMIDSLRPDGGARLADYIGVKFLVVDRFGDFEPTEFVNKQLIALLSERGRLNRKTIIGSVRSLKELKDKKYEPAVLRFIYDLAGGDEAKKRNTLNIRKRD